MNTSNCKTCAYHACAPAGAHCYMFKREPSTKCRQWKLSLIPERVPVRRIELERAR